MNIRILGAHDRESRSSRFTCLLIDDVLAIDAGALSSSLSFRAQQRLKAILLTHQHYDHIRDIPAIGINLFTLGRAIDVYATQTVRDVLAEHLLNGTLYPKMLELPETSPAIRFTVVEPYQPLQIEGCSVLPVPVSHSVPTVGYQLSSPSGGVVFYTADTGPGLADCWEHVSPQLLIIEVTMPDKYEEFARESGHLTPSLLKQELATFRELKGYLPPVVVVHMNPRLEKEIEAEIAVVAKVLNTSITLAYEGMQLRILEPNDKTEKKL